ncbi:MAG: NUDIX domain-containing protein [Rikenellaceae bacterium]|jgi:8-oxo-dGTP pyrophosphatase MutT (NUDIX family)|nr:NUDIX domain-containing protein [Rikenellaceae bacterium]
MKQIYYADKVITFTPDYQTSEGKTLFVPAGGSVSIERLLKSLDDVRELTVYSPDIEGVFARFSDSFARVDAAGGVVADAGGKILMMLRRGFWDLPKGHREVGESDRECAAREVAEECGIDPSQLEVEGEVTRTLHFYWYAPAARWELKRTVWYRMAYSGDPASVTPQAAEEITALEWLTPDEAERRAAQSYRTIRYVLETLNNQSNE